MKPRIVRSNLPPILRGPPAAPMAYADPDATVRRAHRRMPLWLALFFFAAGAAVLAFASRY